MLYTGHRRVCPFPSSVKCVLDIIYRHFFPSGTRNTVQNNNKKIKITPFFYCSDEKHFSFLKLLFRLNIFLEDVWLELNPGNLNWKFRFWIPLDRIKAYLPEEAGLWRPQYWLHSWESGPDCGAHSIGSIHENLGRTVAPTVLAPFMRIWAGIAAAERHFRLNDAIVDCRVDSKTVSANNYESFRLYLRNKFLVTFQSPNSDLGDWIVTKTRAYRKLFLIAE